MHVRCLVAALVILIGAAGFSAPWTTKILRSASFTLNYPSFMNDEVATTILADREAALAFAEETLGERSFRRILVTIEPTLLLQTAYTDATGEGAVTITYYVPAATLRPSDDSTSPLAPFGCHEEVHALAGKHWNANKYGAPLCLAEGLAVYIEELYSGSGHRHAVTQALLDAGILLPISYLMKAEEVSGNLYVAVLNIYGASAALVDWLIGEYGWEAFADLYGIVWMDFKLFGLQTEEPRSEEYYADPEEEFLRIYGLGTADLDAKWYQSLATEEVASAADRARLRRIASRGFPVLGPLMADLEGYWAASPYALVGPSEAAWEEIEWLNDELYRLLGLRGAELQQAERRFEEQIDETALRLTAWLDAIRAYEDAVALVEGGHPEELIALLETAEAGYLAAGDEFMANAAAEWLARLRGDGAAEA